MSLSPQWPRRALALGLVVLLALVSPGVSPAAPAAGESFQYEWDLTRLASIFGSFLLPSKGAGSLSLSAEPGGLLKSELLVTAPDSKNGEFWRYGAIIDPVQGRTVRAWSSYRFRGETRNKAEELAGPGVIDIASAIYLVRRNPPKTPQRLRVWSDGKTYPVVISPGAPERRKVPGRGEIQVRKFSVRGVQVPGERLWKGSLDLWLAEDDSSTPVEIQIYRSYAGVRLRLTG